MQPRLATITNSEGSQGGSLSLAIDPEGTVEFCKEILTAGIFIAMRYMDKNNE